MYSIHFSINSFTSAPGWSIFMEMPTGGLQLVSNRYPRLADAQARVVSMKIADALVAAQPEAHQDMGCYR